MDWNGFLKSIVIEVIPPIICGIGCWFLGLFKGKKVSSDAIGRKNTLYQPLIDDIEKYSNFNWSIIEKVKTPFLKEIVNNSYKYPFNNEKLQRQCEYLYDTINDYNRIDTIRVAHLIIADIFEKGYKEIYGSIIDGVAHHCDRDDNEWDEEILAEPVQTIRQSNYSKEIKSLLSNEGAYLDDEVCVDNDNSLYMPIYLELKRIYSLSLNVSVNGKRYINPEPIIELKILPEEYIALHYDFFDVYNNDERIKRKYELREEIIYTSQSIVQTAKEIIEKIIKIYEVEEL